MDSSTLSYILGGICVVIALVELYFLRRMLHAFRPLRSENRLSDINQSRSHFRFVPDDIGPLTFAASTHYVPTFLSTKEKSKFVGLTVLYVVLSAFAAGLLAYFLWDNRQEWATSAIVMAFVTLILLILLLCILTVYAWKYIPHKCRRQATDMFVGRDGIALYIFKDTREQIAQSKVVRFASLHNILRKKRDLSTQRIQVEYLYIGADPEQKTTDDVELLKLRATHNTALNQPPMLQFMEAADAAFTAWQQTSKEEQKSREEEQRRQAEAAAEDERLSIEAEAAEQRRKVEAAAEFERSKKTDTTGYFSSTTTYN